ARYPRILSAGEMQRGLLQPDEAVLEYFLGAQSSALWVVRRESLAVLQLPRRAEVEAAVQGFVAAISAPDTAHAASGRALSRMILDRALVEAGGVRRLIVIPHGILHYLPFEALPDERGRFLVESRLVSYAPSVSSLAFLRSRPAPPAGEVIAIGNPALQGAGTASDGG